MERSALVDISGVGLVVITVVVGYVIIEVSRHRALIRVAELAAKEEGEEELEESAKLL